MSLATETQRVQQGVKDTLKTLIQKLGGTVGSERVDGYAALASAISNKLLPDNLLSASTAALYGKPGTATPDEVFAMLYNAGNIEKVFESSAAGATTFDLPADTLMWWGLAVGGGGGGSVSWRSRSSDDGTAGVGGAGGKVFLCGPISPSVVSNNSIVIGEGGKGGKKDGNTSNFGLDGSTTSIFGIIFAEGGPGGFIGDTPTNDFGRQSNYYDNPYLFKNFAASSGLANSGDGEDGITVAIGSYSYVIASAGGRGGESRSSGSYDTHPGLNGGNATIGKGGAGGTGYDYSLSTHGQPGFDGNAGGGGGGGAGSGFGGTSTVIEGGNGGSGYAAIFIIRKGGQ